MLSFISVPKKHLTVQSQQLKHQTKVQNIFIYSKLTIKAPEQRHCRGSGVFIVNFEFTSRLFF